MQHRPLLVHQLDVKIMSPNQDRDQYITEVYQLRDELEYIGESFSQVCVMSLTLEGLTN